MKRKGKALAAEKDELILLRERCAAELLRRAEGHAGVELTVDEARWIAALLVTRSLERRGAKRQDRTRTRDERIAVEWEKRISGAGDLPRGERTRIKDDLAEKFHCDRRTVTRAIEAHERRTAGTRYVLELLKARQSGR